MAASMDYVKKKLFATVLSLAQGDGTAKERLHSACVSQLHRLCADDFPPPPREEYAAIQKQLTSVEPSGNDGSYHASIHAMDEMSVHHLIERIVSLYGSVARRQKPLD